MLIRILTLLFIQTLLVACSGLPESFISGEPDKQQPASEHPAVLALLDMADKQRGSGRADRAAATLERAVKIEPRNARLWQQLAMLRFEQGKWRQAENLANKSSALAMDNRHLVAANWRLIARARAKRGDSNGAKRAIAQANGLENH